MNKKQAIQIVIIACALGAAALVLYNGFFKSNNYAGSQDAASGAYQAQLGDLLPNGDTLNFDILKQQGLYYNQVAYPKLDPSTDYGIPESSLIVPPVLPPGSAKK